MNDLLLIAGNDLNAEFYDELLARLRVHDLRVKVVTLPGHPASVVPAPASWSDLSEQIGRFALEHLKQGGTLGGHSLGALVALLALPHAPHAHRLLLLEPAIPPSRFFAKQMSRRYLKNVVHGDRTRFSNWTGTHRRIAHPDRFPPHALDQYSKTRAAAKWRAISDLLEALPTQYPLPRPALPTLVVSGRQAGWRARWLARWLRRYLPRARRVVIDDAAHWLANECDHALAGHIANFCHETRYRGGHPV